MNRLRETLIALTVASVLGLGVAVPGTAAERKAELTVTYEAPRLSVEARGVSLQRILGEIGKKLGFTVVDYGGSDRLVTFSMQEASAEEVLGQLLRGENYAVVYDGPRKEIAKLLLLTSAGPASGESSNPQSGKRKEPREERIVQSQTGLTYHSSFSPVSSFEQKRVDKAESEVKVENIMRAHALSGLIDPMGSLSGAANPQSFGNPAGNAFTGPTSAPAPPQNLHETLQMTTRLAQQNLKALVDGLSTASNSLLQSLPSGGK
jgi:hypothetical protein